MSAIYSEYLRLRYSSALPRSVSEIGYALERIRSGSTAACEAERRALGIDAEYSGRIGDLGGYASPIAVDAARVSALGFEPEYLTARAYFEYMHEYDTLQSELEEFGFTLEEADTRPDHEAVEIKWDRRAYWLRIKPSEVSYMLKGNAWKGMSRGVRAETSHAVLLADAERVATYATKRIRDQIHSGVVRVAVYWRGEEVGSASCAIKIDNTESADSQISETIVANALLSEALLEAAHWADRAVQDAMRHASEIVESVALLPRRSIEAARGSAPLATVTKMRA